MTTKSYFSPPEYSCKCGKCSATLTIPTIALLNRVREEWGGPVTCVSGARCEAHNASVGGAKKSAHLEGLAVDLKPGRGSMEAFHEWCVERLEKWGVRMEDPLSTPTWCHLDLRPVPPGQSRVFKP